MLRLVNDWIIDFDHKLAYKMIDVNTYEVKSVTVIIETNSAIKSFVELPKHVKVFLKSQYPNIKQLVKEYSNATK